MSKLKIVSAAALSTFIACAEWAAQVTLDLIDGFPSAAVVEKVSGSGAMA